MFPYKLKCENDKVIFGERKISVLIREKIIQAIPDNQSQISKLVSHYKNKSKKIKEALKKRKRVSKKRESPEESE